MEFFQERRRWERLFRSRPVLFILGSLFLYATPFTDILPIYMLFLGVTPFILRQLNVGRAPLILAFSIVLWMASQFMNSNSIEHALQHYVTAKLAWFNPLGLQILFVGGLILGFFYVKGTLYNRSRLFLLLMAFLGASFIFLWAVDADLYNARHLGYLRLLTFVVKGCIAYSIASVFTWRPLALLGKHSLFVFSYHVFLAYFLVFFFTEISLLSLELQLASLSLAVLSLWIPVFFLERRKINSKYAFKQETVSS